MTLTGWSAAFFWLFAVAALVTALLTILARNAVHAALFLISTLVSVAALYVMLGAEFIAGVQILVYVGGVMVLFLFVIMLVNVSAEEREHVQLFNRPAQVTTAAIVLTLLSLGFIYAIRQGYGGMQDRDGLGDPARREEIAAQRAARDRELPNAATQTTKLSRDTEAVANSLYRFGSLPFEIASVLLLVAIVGSVMLARTARQERAVDDLESEASPGLGPPNQEI
ncbi:MAG: NADH-quinone oxidoreductase subunit J family protein [Pyrinomonadaceae bacterium]